MHVLVACCTLLQSIAICCSLLQSVVVSCSLLWSVAVCCSLLQSVAICCSLLQSVESVTPSLPEILSGFKKQDLEIFSCCSVLYREGLYRMALWSGYD